MCLQRLSELYYDIHRSYLKVTEVVNSEKRLFGRYYRVAFYGQVSLSSPKLYLGAVFHIAMPTVLYETQWGSEQWGMARLKDGTTLTLLSFSVCSFLAFNDSRSR